RTLPSWEGPGVHRFKDTLSTFSPTTHDVECFLHTDERRVGVAFVFDDIPFHAGGRFADVENLLPRQFVVADERVGFGFRVGFYVDARDAAWFLFEIHDGIAALCHPVAGVELNDDLLLRT